nr:2-dehydropantoate 2-reductase N-terminal domain-containing protein [uncultured Fretibacterium sp.]
MNITIVGLGGVGGIVGGRLAAAAADVPELRVTFWCRGDTLQAILEQFSADHAVLRKHFRVGLFHKLPERCEALVDFLFAGYTLSALPFIWQTFLACGNSCAFAIDGDAAKDGCLAVGLCLLSVDVEQDFECTSHIGFG